MEEQNNLWKLWRKYIGSLDWQGAVSSKRSTVFFGHTELHHISLQRQPRSRGLSSLPPLPLLLNDNAGREERPENEVATKIAPADLMYPKYNWKFRTRLPVGKVPRELDFEELYQRDLEEKMKIKTMQLDSVRKRLSNIQMGDSVLGPVSRKSENF